MPANKFTCPKCQKSYKLSKPRPAGTKIKCPTCEGVFTLADEPISPPMGRKNVSALRVPSEKADSPRIRHAGAMEAPRDIERAEGEAIGRSIFLAVVYGFGWLIAFLVCFFLVWGWFNPNPDADRISWWLFAMGALGVLAAPFGMFFVIYPVLVGERLILGEDRFQIVRRSNGQDQVILQIPYYNMGEVALVTTNGRFLGMDVRELEDPLTFIDGVDFEENRYRDGWHQKLEDRYTIKLGALRKKLLARIERNSPDGRASAKPRRQKSAHSDFPEQLVFRPLKNIRWPYHCINCFMDRPDEKLTLNVAEATDVHKRVGYGMVGGLGGGAVGAVFGSAVGGLMYGLQEVSEYKLPICHHCLEEVDSKEIKGLKSDSDCETSLLTREISKPHVLLTMANQDYAGAFREQNRTRVFESEEECEAAKSASVEDKPAQRRYKTRHQANTLAVLITCGAIAVLLGSTALAVVLLLDLANSDGKTPPLAKGPQQNPIGQKPPDQDPPFVVPKKFPEATGEVARVELPLGNSVKTMFFSPDGRKLIASSYRKAFVFETTGPKRLAELDKGRPDAKGSTLALADDGSLFAIADQNNMVCLFDGQTLEPAGQFQCPKDIQALTFIPGGKKLAVGDMLGIQIWDAAEKKPLGTLPHGNVTELAAAKDGATLAAAGVAPFVKIWDVKSKQVKQTFKTGRASMTLSLAFDRDGKKLAAGLRNGEIRLWHLDKENPEIVLKTNGSGVNALAFSPDGQWLVGGGQDFVIRFWNLTTRKNEVAVKSHEGQIRGIAYSPDGQMLVSSSFDHSLRFWDVKRLLEKANP